MRIWCCVSFVFQRENIGYISDLSYLYSRVFCSTTSETDTSHKLQNTTLESSHVEHASVFVYVVCSIAGDAWFESLTGAHCKGYETK